MNVFWSSHKKGTEIVGHAWTKGAGGRLERVYEDARPHGPAAMYGWVGTAEILRQARELGHDFYYIDNGYLSPGHWSGYFRATRNALQIGPSDRGCPPDYARLNAIGVRPEPWRENGRHIVVALQSREWFDFLEYPGGRDAWLAQTMATIQANSDRPIVVRDKTHTGHAKAKRNPRPLAEDLKEAWALVCHSSNSGVEAIIAGVPVFCLGHGPLLCIGREDLREIENPARPDDETRELWLAWLAANQWTLEEMSSGKCWNDLKTKSR